MQADITIKIDTEGIRGYTDQYVATLWHIAQANPEDGYESPWPGKLVEEIGSEIIRRFVTRTEPELYHHKGSNFDWGQRHLKGDKRAAEKWARVEEELRSRQLFEGIDDQVMANIRAAATKLLREDDSRFLEAPRGT